MSSSQAKLEQGLSCQKAGRLEEAAELYRQVLGDEPRNADAHHLLGVIALAQGRSAQAALCLQTAIAIHPQAWQFHLHLAAALRQLGRGGEAVQSYRQAARLEPGSAVAQNELGSALGDVGQLVEAEACYRRAVELDPQLVAAHNNLGNVLKDQGRLSEAVAVFQHAVRLQPQVAEIHFNLANCHHALGQPLAAIDEYRAAVAARPDFALAYYNLGRELNAVAEPAAAIEALANALRLAPDMADAHNEQGMAYEALGRTDAAIEAFRRALAIRGDHESATYNLARLLNNQVRLGEAQHVFESFLRARPDDSSALFHLAGQMAAQGKLVEASAVYRRIIELEPKQALAHSYLGSCLLSLGEFAAGWPEFAWRGRTSVADNWPENKWRSQNPQGNPPHPQPVWNGGDVRGKRILVYADGGCGFGDIFQWVRYIAMVEQRGAEVVLEVPQSLIPLMEQSGFKQLVARGSFPAPACDLQVSLFSLPSIFETTLDSIPAKVPYLSVSGELVQRWRERLADYRGTKIGICWNGSRGAVTESRTIPLSEFISLSQLRNIQLFSLQKGPGSEELAAVEDRGRIVDFGSELDDKGAFLDTAAVMKCLDLVITCDTSIAHLAGALAVPTWVVLTKVPEWRWLLDRPDSPWYPGMRLFRQTRLHDWSEPFRQIADELNAQ